MTVKCVTEKQCRLARAWYVKYPLDAYALGPYRFDDMVPATRAVEQAIESFGEPPAEIWPEGPTLDCEEYEVELMDPDSDDSSDASLDYLDEEDEDEYEDEDEDYEDDPWWDDEEDEYEDEDEDEEEDGDDPWWEADEF